MNERGSIKWTSLMLPEHIQELKRLSQRQYDVNQPVLSEDQQEEIQRKVREAYETQAPVTIEYYENKRIHSVSGTIDKVNLTMRQLEISSRTGLDYVGFTKLISINY
jgi:adenylate kinase family enzyme